jgi:RNA-directed DNA polymerase
MAAMDARKGKRSRKACFEFDRALGANLEAIHRELHSGAYAPSKYFKFIVYEPKRRVIHAPAFRDTVVQHAIYRVIYGIFDRSFISTSFACRVGYGTHKAARYVRTAMQQHEGNEYTLKMDIRKFFYSINRAILRRLIERKIKDRRLVDVMMMFSAMESPVGIPIGNLLSQIYALIYMNPLDHFIKRVLKARHYVRYVDDFLLVGFTRPECLDLRDRIVAFLKDTLGLELSKSTIQKVRKGVNFCGYRTWRSKVFIRKHSLYKFRKSVRGEQQESAVSLLGHAKHTNSLGYMLKMIKEGIRNGKNLYIPEGYKRLHDLHPAGA